MSLIQPAYRATVYAPRSTDATEATVLTPQVASPPHSDAFRVTTLPNHTGGGFTWRPYLDLPRGRQTKIDIFSRNFDKGQLTLRLLDKRTTAGGTNLERWVTAFTGDSKGAGLLVGRKVKVEESLDGGANWHDHYTGRIASAARDDGRLIFSLHLQDMGTELDDKLFTHPPHPSATTAQAPQMLPLGLEKTWAGLPVSAPITGVVSTHIPGFGINGETVAPIAVDPIDKRYRMVLAGTQPVWEAGEYYVYLTWNSGANSGRFLGHITTAFDRLGTHGADEQMFIRVIGIKAQDPSAPGYAALPAATTAVTIRVQPKQWKVSDRMPILIDDVHPVTLCRWALDGYFGDLNLNGTPRRAVTRYNATGAAGDPFYDLEQDASFGAVREKITESMKRRDFLIKKVLQPRGLALAVDESGSWRIVDVRARNTLGSLPAITNADCDVSKPARWRHEREGAVSRMDTTLYLDRQRPMTDLDHEPQVPPDYAPCLIESEEIPRYDLNISERALDANGKPVTIDGTGFRALVSEWSPPEVSGTVKSDRELRMRREVARVEDEYRRLFGAGPITAELTLRRTTTTDLVRPGRYFLATVDELVDPSTGRLGGQRLLLCTARYEDGLTVGIEALDFGKNTAAANPTIAIAASAADPSHTVDVTATLNADLDPMLVEYAATTTGVAVRPGDTDARWTRAFIAEATGAKSVGHLPSGRRLWWRGGAVPFAWKGFKRVSAYVYPAGSGYIDLTAISGPTAGATSNITKSSFRATWTNANTTDVVDVFLIQSGSAPADWTETYRVATLPAGSTRYDFSNLTAAAASSYTWLARCRDAQGGVSAGTGTTISSGATADTAPKPPKLFASGRGLSNFGGKDARLSDTVGNRPVRIGIELTVVVNDPSYDWELQRAPDVTGAPGTWADVAKEPGYKSLHFDALPSNGLTYWYRHRQSGNGATASDYSDPISAVPQRHYGDVRAIEGARRTATLYGDDGVVADGVLQQDASSLMRLAKGIELYQVRDGVAKSLTRTYASPPLVVLVGGRYRSDMFDTTVWPVGWNSTSDKRTDISFQVTVSTITPRAKKVQEGGTPTLRTAQFTNKNGGALGNLTAVGDYATTGTLGNAPGNGNQYTPRFGVDVGVTSTPARLTNFNLVIGRYIDTGGGSYSKIDELTFSDSDFGTLAYSAVSATPMTAASVGTTGRIKIVVESFSHNGYSATITINPYDNSPGTEGNGVEYYTSTDLEMSLTPNTTDYLLVAVIGQ